jgi:uncharacterized protein YndB with AHSA1/START domain
MAELPALRIRRVLPFRRERVFRAWTTPESMRAWMAPFSMGVAEVELDVRVGGRYRILMRGPDGTYEVEGEYQEVRPPERLAFTWVSSGTASGMTLVTIDLQEQGGGTELVLTHERFPDDTSRERHEAGWGSIAEKLASHLAGERGS